ARRRGFERHRDHARDRALRSLWDAGPRRGPRGHPGPARARRDGLVLANHRSHPGASVGGSPGAPAERRRQPLGAAALASVGRRDAPWLGRPIVAKGRAALVSTSSLLLRIGGVSHALIP